MIESLSTMGSDLVAGYGYERYAQSLDGDKCASNILDNKSSSSDNKSGTNKTAGDSDSDEYSSEWESEDLALSDTDQKSKVNTLKYV
jgi:hypothetical protein